jgi:aryl-alcohol dehydrogenase (NADP+)
MSNENALDAVEQLIPLAAEAGLSLTHMAMAFVMAHPGVTSAILGPRTMAQFDDLLAGAEVRLSDDVLNRIDQIAPPGADVGINEAMYQPPSILKPELRRRPDVERAAG